MADKKSKCNQKSQIRAREDGPAKCHRHGRMITVKDGQCIDTNCQFSPRNAWTPPSNMPGS